jgi:hypothetical protein
MAWMTRSRVALVAEVVQSDRFFLRVLRTGQQSWSFAVNALSGVRRDMNFATAARSHTPGSGSGYPFLAKLEFVGGPTIGELTHLGRGAR